MSMIPPKLTHGDNLANLFEKFNAVIDYLREIRLVPGSGIRINRLPAGTTIESTATATGGTLPIPPEGHPFDAKIINRGTEESPQYYVRIYNSSLPDSSYAGIVYVGDWDIYVPAADIAVTTQNGFYIDLTVTYTGEGRPPFSSGFSLRPYGYQPEQSETQFSTYVAEGKLPSVASRQTTDISVERRWV